MLMRSHPRSNPNRVERNALDIFQPDINALPFRDRFRSLLRHRYMYMSFNCVGLSAVSRAATVFQIMFTHGFLRLFTLLIIEFRDLARLLVS